MVDNDDEDLKTIFITRSDMEKPATNRKYIRLYCHHLCPFSEKVRMILAAKGLRYQKCELDLSKKCAWHFAMNDGKTPVIELPNGTTITESRIIMEYIEDAYPDSGVRTLPHCPLERAYMRVAINTLIENGAALDLYAVLKNKGKFPEDYVKAKVRLQKIEDFLNQRAKDKLFAWGTDHITQLDIHLYPQLFRISTFKNTVFDKVFEKLKFDDYPRIIKYVEDIQKQEFLEPALTKKKPWQYLISELWNSPDGSFVQLKLPVKYD